MKYNLLDIDDRLRLCKLLVPSVLTSIHSIIFERFFNFSCRTFHSVWLPLFLKFTDFEVKSCVDSLALTVELRIFFINKENF